MNQRLPWFPCEPSKLLGALGAMRPHVGYTYWIVCLRCYEVGGACPDNLDALARRTGYSKRVVSDALDVLFKAGKLIRDAAGIVNPYAAKVISGMHLRREGLVASGREGANRRWEKTKGNQSAGNSTPIGSPIAKNTYLDSEVEIKDKKEKEPTLALSGGVAPPSDGWPSDAWEKFYARYPHKVGKPAARKAFDSVRRQRRVGFDEMMRGLERYIAKTDDRPWCNPATWLNQDRWQDEPAPNGGGDGKHRNESTSGARPGGGHRSWASYAASRARAAGGEGS